MSGNFLLIYEPTKTALEEIHKANAEVESIFRLDNNEREFLFSIDTINTGNLISILRKEAGKPSNKMVAGTFRESEVSELIKSEKNIYDHISIYDLLYKDQYNIGDIIHSESPGGDIRKYITTLYGGCQYSICFRLYSSCNPHVTGMEPLSIKSIEKCIELDICDDNDYKGQKPRYPPPSRILNWSDKVEDKWGLECGALSQIHIPKANDEIMVGFCGFVIYDADQNVKEWCDKRWTPSENNENVEYPFLYPDEYDHKTQENRSSHPIPRTAIRMWWD